MKYQFPLLVALTVVAGTAQIGSSSAPRTAKLTVLEKIEGFSGYVTVSHSIVLKQTVIEFRGNSGTSEQIVLRLQHQAADGLPPEWSGTARLLLGRGIVGVLGEDGARRVFHFAERTMPEAFDRLGPFQSFNVVGIARYGGKGTPITAEQIQLLRTTGSCAPATGAKSGGRGPLAFEAGCGDGCSSGGEGSTSCSIQGCSVECQSGYYSCCKQATLNCVCCPRGQ